MSNRRLKIVAISGNYPGPDSLYGEGFVHARVKAYRQRHDVQVIGFKEGLSADRIFTYEDVPVFITGSQELFYKTLGETRFDVLAVHFIELHFIEYLLQHNVPVVVFAHGYESLSWKRRLMNYKSPGDLLHLLPFVRWNRKQLSGMRRLVLQSNRDKKIQFVFVSEWLRNAASEDLGVEIEQATIIPNGIDTALFSFQEKEPEMRNRILLLRSFKARNYANDIAIDAILKMSNKSYFNNLQFTLYGEGYLFQRLTARVKHLENVTANNSFILHRDIPRIHQSYGIFLCPSRLDTQGVSMCEAMSSGLVPVTCPVGGITEYATDGKSALMARNSTEVAAALESLVLDPIKFVNMSREARYEIEAKCSIGDTVSQEVKLFESLVYNL